MIRRPARLTLLAAALVATVTAWPARAADLPPGGAADATLGPLISGTSSYVEGTYVWTDYAYDDRGPDTDQRAGGDADYPAGMDPNNVADLIQLQVAPTAAGTLRITAVLETLTPTTRPVLGVALDTDGDAATGPAALTGSWTPSGALGVDRLFVLDTAGGRTLHGGDAGWEPAGTFAVAVDPERNTVSAEVPFTLPPGDVLRAVAAVGYGDDGGGSWLTGASPVHDLAFVVAESPTTPYLQSVTDAITGFAAGGDTQWQEYRQSAILAGAADVGPAVGAIDLAVLRSGATRLAAPDEKGFHTFLYRSALRLSEGVQGSGNAAFYAGPYQPYLVWVPEDLRPGLPLVVYLHGSSQTHLSAVNTAHYDPSTRDPVLGRPDTFFDFDAVVAWPLGRGPQQWYEGAAEVDPLEVTDDVTGRLGLDRERVMLAGLSMGGYGTFRLAELYPDRWSVAYADVGADRTGLPENLTALPVRFHNGAADYLVHVNQALATRDLLDGAGTVDYRSWILAKGHHQPAVALAECVYRRSFERPRVVDPARVRYTIDPAMFVEDADTGLRLVYDGAYWVSGMRADGDGRASVDITTLAFGRVPVPGETTSTVRENLSAGRDFCGENPEVSTSDAWSEQARAVTMAARPAQARITGTITGLSAVTVDAFRAGVTSGQLELEADGAVELTLAGLRPGTQVVLDGTRTRAGRDGTATVTLATGPNVVRLG